MNTLSKIDDDIHGNRLRNHMSLKILHNYFLPNKKIVKIFS